MMYISSMVKLRDYQDKLISSVSASMMSGHRAPLVVAPCGSGKTTLFSAYTQRAVNKSKRVLILAHRDELLDQIGNTLKLFNVRHEFIASGRPYYPRIPVQVASVFCAVRRLNKIIPPDLIIIDEAHHGIDGSTWHKVFNYFPKAWRIGVTATPCRLSGEPLRGSFDDLVVGPTVSDLIKTGYLSPYKIYAPSSINTDGLHMLGGDFNRQELNAVSDKPTITGDAIKHYRKLADGKRAVVFCVSVEHGKHVADQFKASGYNAVSIDGKMDKDIRRKIINDFRLGVIRVLVSCELISEGLDIPAIECAIMLRPTASLAMWIQQSGRALRPFAGKQTAIILDHAGNTIKHGLPDDERNWSLDGNIQGGRKNAKSQVSVKICPKCFAAQKSGVPVCAICGYQYPVEGRKVAHQDGELVEIDPEVLRRRRFQEQGRVQTLEELIALGRSRGYRFPERWAHALFQARQAKRNAGVK